MRDCCLLEKILTAFYPEVQIVPFHTSRIMYAYPTQEFIDYVTRLYVPGRTLILDIDGAFKSGRDLFVQVFGQPPRVHIVFFDYNRALPFEGLTVNFGSNVFVGMAGLAMEYFNTDVRGSLVDVFKRSRFDANSSFGSDGGVAEVIFARLPLKYRMEYAQVSHDAIDLFCSTVDTIYVRHLLRQLAVETVADNGGVTLSSALFYEATIEIVNASSPLLLFQTSDLLDHYVLQVAFDETYRQRNTSGSYCTDEGDCSRASAVAPPPWSWYPYLDIVAVEWSCHTPTDMEQRGEELLLLEQSKRFRFESTVAALVLYWGPLLRRVVTLQHPLEESADLDVSVDLPVLYSSWNTNSGEDPATRLADGNFTGPTHYSSLHSFAQQAAAYNTANSSFAVPSFSSVIETIDGCPSSWKSVLTRHDYLVRIGMLRPGYSYIIRRDGCGDHEKRNSNGDKSEKVLSMGNVIILQGFAVSCYSCPFLSLPSSELRVNSMGVRGLCNSSLWTMVDPSSRRWTVCSLQVPSP